MQWWIVGWLLASAGIATAAQVENFALLDHQGRHHSLYYHSDARAIVIMSHGNGCPIVRNSLPRLRELRDRYEPRGVVFLLIDSNLQDTREKLVAEAEEFGIDLPILVDETQLVGEALGITRTAEVLLIDPRDWSLAYRGALDDRIGYGTQRAAPQREYLVDALDALLAGQPVARPETEARGCLIHFPQREAFSGKDLSYAGRIAPLLLENCVECHRSGGIAPWAMSDYETVRGFAPMIREVIRTRRMPPWQADPAIGHFQGQRVLAPEQARTLVHWAEAGAPRGEGPDPLLDQPTDRPEWSLGEPDLVLELPAFDVPETGVVPYQFPTLQNPLAQQRWIRAVEFQPGDRRVLHHVIATLSGGATGGRRRDIAFSDILGAYAPGADPTRAPEGSGVRLSPGARFDFQVHYTPIGRATRDRTRMGLYFSDAPPERIYRSAVLANRSIEIPPHAKRYTAKAEKLFVRSVMLDSLLPHSHFRGHSMEYRAFFPDGSEEVLLSVPAYDFNWQHIYVLDPPRQLPPGTRIEYTTVFDNSAQNPANPDPEATVRWGQQSSDEMLYTVLRFRYVQELDAGAEWIERMLR